LQVAEVLTITQVLLAVVEVEVQVDFSLQLPNL
jgi:hypothetical protein